jgi:WD40 repeat protein
MPDPPRVFISYARSDDEPFVKQLYHDLVAAGHMVWWDRVSMPSRALTFLQEIRDAIDEAGRVLLVVGPGAIKSAYVTAEWRYALEACLGVLPVLRFGEYDLLPDVIDKLHCVDMRSGRPYDQALTELLAKLADPVPRPGLLRGDVPTLPNHFQPRPEYIASLRASLLADIERPVVISSALRTAALQGMGGIGKTVLASAFARDCDVRRAFADGIIWLTLGTKTDLLSAMRAVGLAFGDGPQYYVDDPSARARLPQVLDDKVCLVVLDDVWDVAHAQPFINGLGPRGRLLITTRDGGLAAGLGAEEQRVDILDEEAARRLLAEWAEQLVEGLPDAARTVAEECGHLPFALALCGAMAREGIPWADLLQALQEADLSFIEGQLPNYPYPDVLRSLKVSIETLTSGDAQRFQELVVFPSGVPVPEAAILTLWGQTGGVSARNARKLIDTLERRALLRTVGDAPNRRVSLHDLQRDYLRAMQPDPTPLHRLLLDAYAQQCSAGWPSGPNDGYFFQCLAYHLLAADRRDDLHRLLLDYNWLQAKLNATDANSLVADFERLADDNVVQRLGRTLCQSAYILAQDSGQLAGQLWGRLAGDEDSEVQALLAQARAQAPHPYLRPLTASLRDSSALIRTLRGHTGEVYSVACVAVTPDGCQAISASDDHSLKVWNPASGAELRTLQGHMGRVCDVAVTSDGRQAISASMDKTLKVWDLVNGTEVRTLRGHAAPVNGVAVTSDGRLAISTSSDTTLKVWDLASGTELLTLQGHAAPVYGVAVTPDGRQAISASLDKTLKVWDLASGAEWRTLQGHTGRVYSVAVTPDGRQVISASADQTLKVWDLASGAEVRTLQGHMGRVYGVAVTPDGRQAISASDDTTLKVWDLARGAELRTLQGHTGRVYSVAVTPDGRQAISTSADQTLKVWDLASSAEVRTRQGHTGTVYGVAVTPDGRQAISAAGDKTLKIWDISSILNAGLASDAEVRTLRGHTGRVYDAVVTPDGRQAISASWDNTLKVWDLASGTEVCTLLGHTYGVNGVAVTPDCRQAISASNDSTLKVWDLASGTQALTLRGHTGTVWSVAMTPDGHHAISASGDRTLKIWDISGILNLGLASGAAACTLHGHTDGVNSVAVTPDGRQAISASLDSTLKVWDILNAGLASGAAVRTLVGHTGVVFGVAVTPDGCLVVSASNDKTLRVWDLASGRCLATFQAGEGLQACTVAPDGLTIVAGGMSGRVHFLRLENV